MKKESIDDIEDNNDEVKDDDVNQDIPVEVSENQKKFADGIRTMVEKVIEPYAKAVVMQGKKLEAIDGVLQEIQPKIKMLEPVFEQIKNGSSEGGQLPQNNGGGAPNVSAGDAAEFLKSIKEIINPTPQGGDPFKDFFAQMGLKYFQSTANLMDSITTSLTKGAISKNLGINLEEGLGSEMK